MNKRHKLMLNLNNLPIISNNYQSTQNITSTQSYQPIQNIPQNYQSNNYQQPSQMSINNNNNNNSNSNNNINANDWVDKSCYFYNYLQFNGSNIINNSMFR
jgi:hypothetical protein